MLKDILEQVEQIVGIDPHSATFEQGEQAYDAVRAIGIEAVKSGKFVNTQLTNEDHNRLITLLATLYVSAETVSGNFDAINLAAKHPEVLKELLSLGFNLGAYVAAQENWR